jgi:ABC-type transport system involved in multi-copper enzyme maturation permease subunit
MLARLTFRETLAKKTFLAFFLCSTFFLLLLIFAFQFDIVEGNEAVIRALGNSSSESIDMESFVTQLLAISATTLMTAGIFLSIFATAGLVPSMLEKGSIDLLLSKPITRFNILLGRSLGAMAIVFVNMAYLMLGIWIVLGVKTGLWIPEILPLTFVVCILFFIVNCWMVLFGLLLRNSALTIMITYVMFGISQFLLFRDQLYALLSSKFWIYILDALFYLLPRFSEMVAYPVMLINGDDASLWPFFNSLAVAICIFIGASIYFKRADY